MSSDKGFAKGAKARAPLWYYFCYRQGRDRISGLSVQSLSLVHPALRRVVKQEGAHLFTVPPMLKTKKKAELVAGEVVHLEPPEYGRDPLSPQGILAYWDRGPDLAEVFGSESFLFSVVRGPVGADRRTVGMAQRTKSNQSKWNR